MEHFSFNRENWVTGYCRDRLLVSRSNAWRKSLDQKRNAPIMAILTRKSKIFIKAKVIFMKRCLLGHVDLWFDAFSTISFFQTQFVKKDIVKIFFFLHFSVCFTILYNIYKNELCVLTLWSPGNLAQCEHSYWLSPLWIWLVRK